MSHFPSPVFRPCRCQSAFIQNSDEAPKIVAPAVLQRSQSIAGRVVVTIEDDGLSSSWSSTTTESQSFLLQRKMEALPTGGSIRAAYPVEVVDKSNPNPSSWTWRVKPDEKVVAIMVIPKHQPGEDTDDDEKSQSTTDIPLGLSALKLLQDEPYVVGSSLMAADDLSYYSVLPFANLTLLDYLSDFGGEPLPEADAGYFFLQILQGLGSLRKHRICHLSLTLANVWIDPHTSRCRIGRWWGTAVRVCSHIEEETGNNNVGNIRATPPSGGSPQFMAPELLLMETTTTTTLSLATNEDTPVMDGYAVDLWAAGVMLLLMLVPNRLVFDAPLPEDPRYREICLEHRLQQMLQKTGTDSKGENVDNTLSTDAIDLLQSILVADPTKRLTLEGVQNHPWVSTQEQMKTGVPTNLRDTHENDALMTATS